MASSLLPRQRVALGEYRRQWASLKDTDAEEQWTSARDIPRHIRDYERARWRLVQDDPDERVVSSEDVAWQDMQGSRTEAQYYRSSPRWMHEEQDGADITASLLQLDERVPVVQFVDVRPTVDWETLGGQAALSELLRAEKQRLVSFVEYFDNRARFNAMRRQQLEQHLSAAVLQEYENASYGRILRKSIRVYKEDIAAAFMWDLAGAPEFPREVKDMLAAEAVGKAQEAVVLRRQEVLAEIELLRKQYLVITACGKEARLVKFAMTPYEYRKYQGLLMAKLEWDRSYCKGHDEEVRARFPLVVCAMCGSSRIKLRRHPSHHWYSSCPQCEDTAPLVVADVKPPRIPDNEYPALHRIRKAMFAGLRELRPLESTVSHQQEGNPCTDHHG